MIKLALLSLLTTALCSPAWAWPHGSVVAICPVNTRSVDGCSAAPPYVNATLTGFQANLMTSAGPQNGQVYTPQALAAISFNQAGVAPGYYAGTRGATYCNSGLGIPCSPNGIGNPDLAGLIDPTTYNWTTDPAHTHCVSASYSAGQINCQVQTQTLINFVGFDMSVGGCIALNINNDTSTGTSNVYVTDNYFHNAISTGCTGAIVPWRVQLANAVANVSYNSIDGNMIDLGIQSNSEAQTPWDIRSLSGATITHNWVKDDPSRMFTVRLGTAPGFAQGNVFHNMGAYVNGNHGEHFVWNTYDLGTSTYNPAVTEYNDTGWIDANTGPNNTAPFVLTAATGYHFTAWTYKDNTNIVNGFTHTTAIESNPGVSAAGSGYSIGDLVTIQMTYNGGTLCEVEPIVKLGTASGSSVIPQNSMACGTALPGQIGVTVDSGAFATTTTGAGTGMTFTKPATTGAWSAGNLLWSGLTTTVDNLTITGNVSDYTGIANGNKGYVGTLGSIACSNPATISGNIDLLSATPTNATFNSSSTGLGTGCVSSGSINPAFDIGPNGIVTPGVF